MFKLGQRLKHKDGRFFTIQWIMHGIEESYIVKFDGSNTRCHIEMKDINHEDWFPVILHDDKSIPNHMIKFEEYQAKFKSWTNYLGVAVFECSDGLDRIIPITKVFVQEKLLPGREDSNIINVDLLYIAHA